MGKFHGDIDSLKSKVVDNGLVGTWSETGGTNKFMTNDGGILLWYATGTLLCQGRGPSKIKIEKLIEGLNGTSTAKHNILAESSLINPAIFIVYGHDETSRDQLELVLSKLGIDPFILAKTSGNGLTIIEALEKQVGKNGTASVGIVLLTPDDFGYSKKEGEEAIKGRARQNVILEMGMLISKLGRSNTIILIKGKVERPSDTDGIIYHAYNTHIKEVVIKLIERLESAGFKIDHKKALETIR